MIIKHHLARVARAAKNKLDFVRQDRALRELSGKRPRRIVIGSSGTRFPGWVSTDRQCIDLLRETTWTRYFSPASIDAMLAEHVWEHLTAPQAEAAAAMCFRFLAPGGHLRVAVPDGLHVDPAYVESVRPGGTGSGAEDHHVLYTYKSLSSLFERAGFDVRLYEYFDESGSFHRDDWDPADGMISRSVRFDPRNADGKPTFTSIVLDALKPKVVADTAAGTGSAP